MRNLKGALIAGLLLAFCTFFAIKAKAQVQFPIDTFWLYDGHTNDFQMAICDTSIDITMDTSHYHVAIDSVYTNFYGTDVYVPVDYDYYGNFIILSDYIGIMYKGVFTEFHIVGAVYTSCLPDPYN